MQKKGNTLIVLLLIVISFFAGYLFFKVKSLEQGQGKALGTTEQKQVEPKIKKPDTKEHWQGAKNARYVWIEYADLQCPYCKQIHPDLTKLLNVNSGKLAWVFRHFPLPLHEKAQKGAETTECASEQGGSDVFWKSLEVVFEKLPETELSDLPRLAEEIGVDEAKLKTCLDSGKFEKKVKDQLEEGTQAGVQGTPHGIIYDMKTGKNMPVSGALPYDSLQKELDNFISSK